MEKICKECNHLLSAHKFGLGCGEVSPRPDEEDYCLQCIGASEDGEAGSDEEIENVF